MSECPQTIIHKDKLTKREAIEEEGHRLKHTSNINFPAEKE